MHMLQYQVLIALIAVLN